MRGLAEVVAETLALERFLAAAMLCHAVDTLRELERCERAAGRAYVTSTDREAVKVAGARWTVMRG